ncbi:permease IIC component [Lactobacillus nasalidis]|nr:permease IIC component [Lactobacillus nasalidis]
MIDWLERYLLPLANDLASVRWLVALRDAFVSTLPISLTGSVAVLIKSLIVAADRNWGWHVFYQVMQPTVATCNFVWRGSVAMFALFFVLSWGYQLARACEVDPLAGAMTALCSFMMSIANYSYLLQGNKRVKLNQAFNIKQLSTTGMFTAILFGGLGVALYILGVKARLGLRIQSQMPPAQVAAFEAAIPVMLALFIVGGLNYLFQTITGQYFGDWLLEIIQLPLLKLGQGFVMVIAVTALTQLFWFFGINGSSALAPVVGSIWATAQNANLLAAANGHKIPYLWTSTSFVVFGVSGVCLPLVIAILLASKRGDHRTLAKVALAPAVFNVNEPMLYGMPIILNPVYFLPFTLAPLANVSLAYLATRLGWVNRVQASVPNIMPPVIGPYLACNYDWRALVLSLLNLLVAVLIWLPFVKAADKIGSQGEPRRFFMPQY